jgi:hypothetical protein
MSVIDKIQEAIYWYAEATNSVDCRVCGFTFNPGAEEPDSAGMYTCRYCEAKMRNERRERPQ